MDKILDNTHFNLEEKLYLNKLAFKIFKDKYYNAEPQEFSSMIKRLISRPFKDRIYLFLELIDENDNLLLNYQEVSQFFKSSFIQNISDTGIEVDDVIK